MDCSLSYVKQPGPQLLKKPSKYLGSKAGELLLELYCWALSFPYQGPEGRGLTAQQWGHWHLAQGKAPAPRTLNFSPPGDNMLWLFRAVAPAPTGVRTVISSVQNFFRILVSSPALPILLLFAHISTSKYDTPITLIVLIVKNILYIVRKEWKLMNMLVVPVFLTLFAT